MHIPAHFLCGRLPANFSHYRIRRWKCKGYIKHSTVLSQVIRQIDCKTIKLSIVGKFTCQAKLMSRHTLLSEEIPKHTSLSVVASLQKKIISAHLVSHVIKAAVRLQKIKTLLRYVLVQKFKSINEKKFKNLF